MPNVAAALDGARLVILAGPPLAILATLADEADELGAVAESGGTITDVGSTKRRIVDAAAGAGLPFVGGHPMAGRETTGAATANPDLFVDRPWVIVPGAEARPDDVQVVEMWPAQPARDPSVSMPMSTTPRSRRSATCPSSSPRRSWRP